MKYGASCAKTSEEFFKKTLKDLTYKSKTTQNEIIDICGDLSKNILNEIHEARFFSILANEAADCNNIKQLSVVIRFVDKMHCIREEFLGFLQCKQGLTGEAIPTTIKDFFHEQNLAIDDCHGQGNHGADNIAGKPSGVATRIQELNEKAFHVHCNSHILNLCINS